MSLFKRKKPEEKLSFKIKMAEKMVRNRLRYATERDGDTDSVIGKNGGFNIRNGQLIVSADNRVIFLSPKELRLPEYFLSMLPEGSYVETDSLDDVIGDVDILYMSRVQRERFVNEEEYIRLKDVYILDRHKIKRAKDDMIVMHPLPRVNEIATEVDDDPRAVYFKQAKFGMYVRMALISKLLGVAK